MITKNSCPKCGEPILKEGQIIIKSYEVYKLKETIAKYNNLIDNLLFDISNQYEHQDSIDPYLVDIREFMIENSK